MQKRVAIVNGMMTSKAYNALLCQKYRDLGYSPTCYKYNPICVTIAPSWKFLESKTKSIVQENDVIHALSSSSYLISTYLVENAIIKPLVMESVALNRSAQSFLSALNMKHIETKTKVNIINWIFKNITFSDNVVKSVQNAVGYLSTNNYALHLQSQTDEIACVKGFEHFVHKFYKEGSHAKLFFKNDFKIVEAFLETFENKIQK